MLVGKVVAPLFSPAIGSSLSGGSTSTTLTGAIGGTIGSPANVGSPILPWAGTCTIGSGGSSGSSLFGDGFFDDIGSSLAGGKSGGGMAYTPVGSLV